MANANLQPEEFIQAWGVESLARLPEGELSRRLPPDDGRFLITAGLPVGILFHEFVSESGITFRRLATGGMPLIADASIGAPEEWSAYWIIGDEYATQTSAWWFIDQNNGHILWVNCDQYDRVQLVNVSVRRFAASLVATVAWTERCIYVPEGWSERVDELEKELAAIDPEAIRSGVSFWKRWLDFIRVEKPHPDEPGQSGFRKTSPAASQFYSEYEPCHKLHGKF